MRHNHPLKKTHHLTVIPGLVLMVIFGAAAAVYLGFITVPALFSRDEVRPDLSAIQVSAIAPTADENGFPALSAALTLTPLTDLDVAQAQGMYTNREWSSTEATALTKKYTTLLDTATTAAGATMIIQPEFFTAESTRATFDGFLNSDPNFPASWYTFPMTMRAVGQLLSIRAHQQALNGDYPAGLASAATVAKLGQTLANGRSTLIGQSIFSHIMVSGFETFQAVAATAPADAVTKALPLLPTGDTSVGAMESLRVESGTFIDRLPQHLTMDWVIGSIGGLSWFNTGVWSIAASSGQDQFMFHPNETKRLMAANTAENIREVSASCTTVTPESDEKDWNLIRRGLFQANGFGQISAAEYDRMMQGVAKHRCDIFAKANILRTAAAARAFEITTGALPGVLTELVPGYLPSVPLDPYTGQAPKYDAIKRLIFTAGVTRTAAAGDPDALYWSVETPTVKILNGQETVSPSASVMTNLYYIAVDDNGGSGEKIGCGDSVVAVKKPIATQNLFPNKQVEVALKALFADTAETVGESGLKNTLAASKLTVLSVDIVQRNGLVNNNAWDANTTMRVKLSGTISSGGTCDDPRISAQILQTIAQFTGQSKIDVTVNGQPLATILSSRGE